MVAAFVSSALLILASIAPTVEQLEEGRFRVKVVFDDPTARGNVAAQVALATKAQEVCRGKGSAVSEGALDLNDAAPIKGTRKAFELAEVYICAEIWDQPSRRR